MSADIDASLRAAEAAPDTLDDGFAPPPLVPAPPAPDAAQAALGEQSPF